MTRTSSSPSETLSGLRARLRDRLLRSDGDPRDADALLCHVLDRSLAYVISHSDDDVAPVTRESVSALIERRLSGEPLQYIRGYSEFYGRRFAVDRRVLIPRPETELLVERAIRDLRSDARVLDVGTGSGCIAISIEREVFGVRVTGSDSSTGALALARSNAAALDSQTLFCAADFVAPFRVEFDLVVSNPPYIAAEVVEGLEPVVRDYEPRHALTPGPRGTEAFEVLLREVPRLLTPDGLLMLEIGFDQAAAIRTLASEAGWVMREIIDDLAGIPRVVVLSRP